MEDPAKKTVSFRCLPAEGPTIKVVPLVCDVTVGEMTVITSFTFCSFSESHPAHHTPTCREQRRGNELSKNLLIHENDSFGCHALHAGFLCLQTQITQSSFF